MRARAWSIAIVTSLCITGLSPAKASDNNPVLEPGGPLSSNSDSVWDADFAASLTGDLCLIGVTILDGQKVVDSYQMHGRVVSVSATDGIVYELLGRRTGEQWKSPPYLENFQKARPGTYTQKSDGDKVDNPDWLVTWEIHQPSN